MEKTLSTCVLCPNEHTHVAVGSSPQCISPYEYNRLIYKIYIYCYYYYPLMCMWNCVWVDDVWQMIFLGKCSSHFFASFTVDKRHRTNSTLILWVNVMGMWCHKTSSPLTRNEAPTGRPGYWQKLKAAPESNLKRTNEREKKKSNKKRLRNGRANEYKNKADQRMNLLDGRHTHTHSIFVTERKTAPTAK